MRRRRFNLLAALSLLAGIAVAGVWVRSYWGAQCLSCYAPPRSASLIWDDGSLVFEVYQGPFVDRGPVWFASGNGLNPWLGDAWWNRLAFGWQWIDQTDRWRLRLSAPCWAVLIFALLLPAGWLLNHRRRLHRERQGLCRQCGYDLRASPDRCPECGTIAEAPTTNPQPRTTPEH